MSDWQAFIEDDDQGNVCIYLQRRSDAATREVFEMVEHDVKDSLPGQKDDYFEEAEEEADRRNSDDEDEDD